MRPFPVVPAILLVLLVASCAHEDSGPAVPASKDAPAADPCEDRTGALEAASFVLVASPDAGATVEPGFEVVGCSRTFESTVHWRLVGRDGAELARGFAGGGGVDGPASFRFAVDYRTAEAALAYLEVLEPDPSDGEGFPPGRTVLPLVLRP